MPRRRRETETGPEIVNIDLRDAFVDLVARIEQAWKTNESFVEGRPSIHKIQLTDEHRKFENKLREDKTISPWISKTITTDGLPPRTLTLPQIVSNLIGDYPYYAVELAADHNSVYMQFEQTFHTSSVTLRALAPVYWISPMFDMLSLDEQVVFRRVRLWEQNLYAVPNELPEPLNRLQPSSFFEAQWKQPIRLLTKATKFAWAPTYGNTAFNHFRFCLRLLGYRFFETPSLYIRSPMGIGLGYQHITQELNPFNATQTMEYDDTDFSKLKALWGSTVEIMGKNLTPWLQLGLSKMNTGCGRREPADVLLDFTIAMESLLQYENAPEITYRLKSRAAAIMGLGQDERTIPGLVAFAEDIIKRAYDMRSSIVHGETEKYNEIDQLLKINSRLFDLLRIIGIKIMCLSGDKRYTLGSLIEGSMKSPLTRRYLDRAVAGSPLVAAVADFF